MHRLVVIALLILTTLAWGCNTKTESKPTAADIIKRRQGQSRAQAKPTGELALKLFETGSTDEAWQVAQQVLLQAPKDTKALYVAAKVMHKRGKIAEAINLLDQIPAQVPNAGLMAAGQAGEWALELGDVRQAERRFRAMKTIWPDEKMIDQKMAQLLTLQNRRWESAEYLRRQVRLKLEAETTLMMLINLAEPVSVATEVERTLRLNPSDPLPKLGTAFYSLHLGQTNEALQQFQEVWNYGQAPTACWIGLGLAYSQLDQFEKIPEWLISRPADADKFPEYWIVLGNWFDRQSQPQVSSRCFAESVALDAERPESLHRFGALLAQVNMSEGAVVVLERAKHMENLTRHLQRVSFGNKNAGPMSDVASELVWLGRPEEAARWFARAGKEIPATESSSLAELRKVIDKTRESFPLPDLKLAPTETKPPPATELAASAEIRFEEKTDLFEKPIYFDSGDDLSEPGMTIFQSNGGGVAVIDFDRDGWQDLYVLQGGKDPTRPSECTSSQLMRNQRGQRFVDAATIAGVTNNAYGTGAGVGDWDQDGFADLYVGNFGTNKLYQNNGDGTFSLVNAPGDDGTMRWTASCAVADISGDGLPDLIDINYANAKEALKKICVGANNVPRVCRPTEFAVEQDRIFVNQGDGTFVPGKAEFPFEDGRGLGLVVANFDRKHGNDIYVANDWSANTFLVSQPDPKNQGRFVLRDEAGQRGCAVDSEGRPQASMGIACGDVNHDGLLDLFVTNFYDEYNTLYLQKSNSGFDIASRRYRLMESSFNILGFGTQFGDFNHDGWLDIAIVNGNVDDFRSEGRAYQMPAQVLINRGHHFEWQPAATSGPYFELPRIGRALASWDYDRDGKLDLVATHIDQPLAVLKNTTSTDGAWLELELVGTTSDRDAVGSFVEIHAGDKKWTAAVTAGDGYECANEKIIHVGLGQAARIDQVIVGWPSGKTETFGPLANGQRVQLIESTGN
jgi:tetratricopeptide (TPR) repeat protein